MNVTSQVWFQFVLIAGSATITLSRLVNARRSTWEVVAALALGLAWGLLPAPPKGKRPSPTFALALFVITGALMLADPRLSVVLLALTSVGYGLRGLATGRIHIGGRVGPGREYTGTAGHVQSALCIACGAAAVALAFAYL